MATELETEVQAIDKSLLECSAEEIAAVRRARSARGGEAARLSGPRRGRAGRGVLRAGGSGGERGLGEAVALLPGCGALPERREEAGVPYRAAPGLPNGRAADWRLSAASPAAVFTRRTAVGGGGPLGGGALWN